MTDSSHDRAAQTALAHLTESDPGEAPRSLPAVGMGALESSYVDLMALLPFADSPAVPDPSIKQSLLDRIGAASSGRSLRAEAGAASTGGRMTAAGDDAVAAAPPAVLPWSASRDRFIPLAMAAMLGLCIIGLAILGNQVRVQKAELLELAARVEVSDSLAEQQADFVATALQQSSRHLDMITKVARQAYPMRGVVETAANRTPGESPRGVVWVCGEHQRWYLNVQGLEQPPRGKTYTLWFVTDQGMVNAGPLDVTPRRLAELEAQFMPVGTRSFQVTLEPDEIPSPSRPRGVPVLVADRSVRL